MKANLDIIIRREREADFRRVEELTRDAFWNIYTPGCDAHYLLHQMRSHADFRPEYDFVATINDEIVGSIVYTSSFVTDENDRRIDTLTFGPISVAPPYQRQGIGSRLINHTIRLALRDSIPALIIYGNPANYVKFGFIGSKKMRLSTPEGSYPCSLLVKELKPGVFDNHEWHYHESTVFTVNPQDVAAFDRSFPPKVTGYDYHQEEFAILSRAFVQ